jgi:MoaA/NifB/PqqE/SkfB family radical SAM enzyme
MKIINRLNDLEKVYNIVGRIDLDVWDFTDYESSQTALANTIASIRKDKYQNKDRIIVKHSTGDLYTPNSKVGLVLRNLQNELNQQDISNFFVILLSSNPHIGDEFELLKAMSSDEVPITVKACIDEGWKKHKINKHPLSEKEIYEYGSANPLKIDLKQLSNRENFLLDESKMFCMYPWVHLHAWPTGGAYPCCMAEHDGDVGNTKENTLEEIWNGPGMREIRNNMLNEKPSKACVRCYESENSGFFSGRKSANKHHGHHIERALATQSDGSADKFEMTYWDIRFSNLCNLSCRSCGHIFSSSWYKDQAALAGPEWKKQNQVLNYAGRTEMDMWEQLEPHLEFVEQIYFAGGEPLMMKEHYNILDELEKRGKFDVRLVYNTNFTHTKLKDREVFDYWKKFDSVAVGASLDGMGPQAEYIRKGTKWDVVERNRELMMKVCPNVDFYVSPTLSIMNAWHITDFHKSWVEKGYIRHQDLNVNCLQDPAHFRIDIAPNNVKKELIDRYEKHLEWLRPHDKLNRATVGFESAINFLKNGDHSHLIPEFWRRTDQLDVLRKEGALDILPELEVIR